MASVSCIYSLGDPIDYKNMVVSLRPGMEFPYEELMRRLTDIQYERNDIAFERNRFRVRGDTVEIWPVYTDSFAYRIEFFGDEIDSLSLIEPVTGATIERLSEVPIYPAGNFVTTKEKTVRAVSMIQDDLVRQIEHFENLGRPMEAKRLKQRVEYDLEMIKEMGYCPGIENYSRYLDGRKEGQRPFCLIDYFPDDFVTFIDESHVTIPQIRAMYGGDHSRKSVLIEYGFRLPAAADNRPLKFEEFEELTGQKVFVSATPSEYELRKSEGLVVEQVVRPTGLLDPPIEVRPTLNQVDDLLEEIRKRAEVDERVLVTTLTKRMAEELDDFFGKRGVRCRYIHSDVDTAERVEIIEDFKNGLFDVLIGVNLLREGLDIPTVSLVAILDADKEGFLRSQVALTQTAGRAARNIHGLVIMYADSITRSMQETIYETDRRRKKQIEYNELNHITPKQVEVKHNALISQLGGGRGENQPAGHVTASNSYDAPVFIPDPSALGKGRISVGLGDDSIRETNTAYADGYVKADLAAVLQDPVIRSMSREQVEKAVEESRRKMKKAAAELDYAAAAKYRDEMWALEQYLKVWKV